MKKESRYLEYATLAESVIYSDKFLSMPYDTQLLYVFINASAWVDGLSNNCQTWARFFGCGQEGIDLLVKNGFLTKIEDSHETLYQITHWDIHNFNHLANNRSSGEYAKWKKAVLERDGCCQHCGSTENLVVHHIKPYKQYPMLRTDIVNGIVLCKECHKKVHSKENKAE